MAAPRSTSLRALRVLSQQHTTTPCVRRSLHITGAHSAQPVNVTDKASFYATRTLADLKLECQKRSIGSNGTQAEVRILDSPVIMHELQLILLSSNHSLWNAFPTMISFNPVLLVLP